MQDISIKDIIDKLLTNRLKTLQITTYFEELYVPKKKVRHVEKL